MKKTIIFIGLETKRQFCRNTTKLFNVSFVLIIALMFFTSFASGGDGDVYYFTDTDITWENTQFSIVINLCLFIFFFWIGYMSPKRSGGGFMILSGFMLFALEGLLTSILSAFYVLPLITPIALFILLLGIRKQFYYVEGDKTNKEVN